MYIPQWYKAEDCDDIDEFGVQCDAKACEMEWDDEIGVWFCPKCGDIQ